MRIMTKQYVCLLFSVINICCLMVQSDALAARTPKSLSTDYRIKHITYDPNEVVTLTGVYGYQTSVEFAEDESVKLVTLGDSIAWQTVPYMNRLFIKPVEDNADTNMTVVTNKRTYYFHLSSATEQSQLTFLVRFMYPNMGVPSSSQESSLPMQISQLHWDYSSSGNKEAVPLARVFDDGKFTYFLFDEDKEIPSVYVVDAQGYEAIVNTRREGPYLVAERTAAKFTLRNGDSYLCVRNNALVTPDKTHSSEPKRRG